MGPSPFSSTSLQSGDPLLRLSTPALGYIIQQPRSAASGLVFCAELVGSWSRITKLFVRLSDSKKLSVRDPDSQPLLLHFVTERGPAAPSFNSRSGLHNTATPKRCFRVGILCPERELNPHGRNDH